MRRAVAMACFALAAFTAGAARAAPPEGRIAIVSGGQGNVGRIADQYFLGWVFGIEAGYQPRALGLSWSLRWTRFSSASDENVNDTLLMTDMGFALRLRQPLGPDERAPALIATTGMDILRTSIAVPPDDSRLYYGPAASIGLERTFDEFMISMSMSYGLFVNGPSAVTLLLSLGVGSH